MTSLKYGMSVMHMRLSPILPQAWHGTCITLTPFLISIHHRGVEVLILGYGRVSLHITHHAHTHRLAPRDLTLILRQSQIQRLALIGMLNTHPVLLLRAVVMEPSAHQSRQ